MKQRMGQILESDRTTTEKIVLVVLCGTADGEEVVDLWRKHICRSASIHERTLRNVLRQLEGDGLVERQTTRHGRPGLLVHWDRLSS